MKTKQCPVWDWELEDEGTRVWAGDREIPVCKNDRSESYLDPGSRRRRRSAPRCDGVSRPAPSIELRRLGARRLRAGSGIARAVYGQAKELAAAFRQDGESVSVATGGMTYTDINALFP